MHYYEHIESDRSSVNDEDWYSMLRKQTQYLGRFLDAKITEKRHYTFEDGDYCGFTLVVHVDLYPDAKIQYAGNVRIGVREGKPNQLNAWFMVYQEGVRIQTNAKDHKIHDFGYSVPKGWEDLGWDEGFPQEWSGMTNIEDWMEH